MIGGADHDPDLDVWDSTKETHRYIVSQNKWSKGPDLNISRYYSSATYLNGFIYTFFGASVTNSSYEPLNSIEKIDTSTFKEWELVQTNNESLIPRYSLAVVPLNNNEILVCGEGEGRCFSEVFSV